MINCFKDPIDVLMNVLLSCHEDEDHVNDDGEVLTEESVFVDENGGDSLTLRSSLRRVDDSDSTEATKKKKKKKVQWVDVMGVKELAEIREFESSEEDDIDYGRRNTCVCVIL